MIKTVTGKRPEVQQNAATVCTRTISHIAGKCTTADPSAVPATSYVKKVQ